MKNYFEEIGLWPRSHDVARAYTVGFVLSLVLTVIAYALVAEHALPQQWIIAAIVAAAALQCVVQAYCFLHLGTDRSSRERLFVLGFAALIITILVFGSLWIMFSLRDRMMLGTAQEEQYMNEQVGF